MRRKFCSERDVKQAVKDRLRDYGTDVWWFMPAMNGFGRAGIPDFVGFYKGRGWAVETKFNGNKATPRQEAEAEKIARAGAHYYLVDETNVLAWRLE